MSVGASQWSAESPLAAAYLTYGSIAASSGLTRDTSSNPTAPSFQAITAFLVASSSQATAASQAASRAGPSSYLVAVGPSSYQVVVGPSFRVARLGQCPE